MSAAMVAVGYIVRLHIAILVFFGGAFGWLIAIPLLGEADPNLSPAEAASALWSTQIRYIGVGAMLVGGLHAIWSVRGGIWSGITALRGVRGSGGGEASAQERTSRDMRLVHLVLILALCAVGTVILYDFLIGSIWAALLAAVLMLLAAFLFVAVATYIVGLVGSSHSPVSGMTICALLFAALVLLVLGVSGDSGILATLGVAGVVACAACTAGDCSQDLKTGYLVGATPVRQQWVEIAGAVLPAFFIAPVLSLLHNAYGIGTGEPNALAAPQAQLFASLAEGVFRSGQLPWDMVGIGIGVAVALLILNIVLRALNVDFQAHVMPVAVGIYLPFSLSVPILIGGFIRYYISRSKKGSGGDMRDAGILFGSGLIAGEALMGIGLAVPIVLGQDLPLMDPFQGLSIVSVILFLVLLAVYGAYARKQEA
jgi:putative OPT family oligopeptide transporter